VKRMNPKPRRRYRSRPRWANPPRTLNPRKDSPAEKRARMPRAFARKATDVYSNAALERGPSKFFSSRSLMARLLYDILHQPPKVKRPPDVPRTFTVDTGPHNPSF